jgi:type IV pilus assembly protein PilF
MATRQWMINRVAVGLMVGLVSLGSLGCGQNTANSTDKKKSEEPKSQGRSPNYANAAKIYAQLGLAYLSQGQVVRAKEKLTAALKYAPKNAEVISAWGIYWEQVGDQQEARMFHEKAIRMAKPEQIGIVYDAYGSFLCRQDNWVAAQNAFHRALSDRQSLKLAFIYESAGLCAAHTKHTAEAEDYLTKAMQMDSQRASAALALAQLKVQQGSFTDASKWLIQYEKCGPQTAQSVLLALKVAKGLHQSDQAANLELLFKRSFHDTPEYQAYRGGQAND